MPTLVKEHVDHGDDEILWCGIALGYEDPDHPANSFKTEREELESYAKILEGKNLIYLANTAILEVLFGMMFKIQLELFR